MNLVLTALLRTVNTLAWLRAHRSFLYLSMPIVISQAFEVHPSETRFEVEYIGSLSSSSEIILELKLIKVIKSIFFVIYGWNMIYLWVQTGSVCSAGPKEPMF